MLFKLILVALYPFPCFFTISGDLSKLLVLLASLRFEVLDMSFGLLNSIVSVLLVAVPFPYSLLKFLTFFNMRRDIPTFLSLSWISVEI